MSTHAHTHTKWNHGDAMSRFTDHLHIPPWTRCGATKPVPRHAPNPPSHPIPIPPQGKVYRCLDGRQQPVVVKHGNRPRDNMARNEVLLACELGLLRYAGRLLGAERWGGQRLRKRFAMRCAHM